MFVLVQSTTLNSTIRGRAEGETVILEIHSPSVCLYVCFGPVNNTKQYN